MSDRPNILWLMADEQRADSMGFEGAPWASTPNLDRLALLGTRFTSAYTPSPVCVPARASLLTGRAASSIGVLNNHYQLSLDDPQFLTWMFAAAGYQVASYGKQHYNCSRRAFDVEGGQVLGDRVGYLEYRVPVDPKEAGVVRYDGGKTPWLFAGRYPGGIEDTPEMHNVEQALEWVRRRDPSRPYLLRVSFNAPHTPVVTPSPFDTSVDPDRIHLPIDVPGAMAFASATQRDFLCEYAGTQRLSVEQIRRARQCYYGHVRFVDHAFGRLLDTLREMGELEHTIVAYVSDHGAHLGDHGFYQKQSFWEPSARVPFFLCGPGIRQADEPVSTPVNVSSLLPTLLELAGLEIPEYVQYSSLARALRDGRPPVSDPVFSEIDLGLWRYRSGERQVMVRHGRWKLVLYRDPREPDRHVAAEDRVLHDLIVDPGERQNLAAEPAYGGVMDDLIAEIDAWDRSRPILPEGLVERRA
jgi:arylsulfatase A-like enzyme